MVLGYFCGLQALTSTSAQRASYLIVSSFRSPSQGKPLKGKPAAIAEVLRGKVEKKIEAKNKGGPASGNADVDKRYKTGDSSPTDKSKPLTL